MDGYYRTALDEAIDSNREDGIYLDYDTMIPLERLRLYCNWKLGDPNWADAFVDAMGEFGFTVKVEK